MLYDRIRISDCTSESVIKYIMIDIVITVSYSLTLCLPLLIQVPVYICRRTSLRYQFKPVTCIRMLCDRIRISDCTSESVIKYIMIDMYIVITVEFKISSEK